MAFDPAEIEDGTGKAGALVYEEPDTVAAWLTRRLGEASAFAAADEDEQIAALLRATETAEAEVARVFAGVPLSAGQGLLFPALGAYGAAGILISSGSNVEDAQPALPVRYLEGIRLLAEEAAAGRLMRFAGGPAGIKSESSKRGSITYRDTVNLHSIAANHAEAWTRIATVLPPL